MPTGESPDDLALADALRPPPSAIPLTSDVLSFVSSHTSRRPISPSHPIIQTATQQNKRAKTPNPVGLLPSRPRLPFRAPSPEVGPPSRQRLGLRAACRRFHPPRRPASLRFVLAIRTLQSARFQVPSSAFRLPRSPIFHLRPPSPPPFFHAPPRNRVPKGARKCQKVPESAIRDRTSIIQPATLRNKRSKTQTRWGPARGTEPSPSKWQRRPAAVSSFPVPTSAFRVPSSNEPSPSSVPSPELAPPSRQRLGLRAACRRFHPEFRAPRSDFRISHLGPHATNPHQFVMRQITDI